MSHSSCKVLCKSWVSDHKWSMLRKLIDRNYMVTLVADGMPALTSSIKSSQSQPSKFTYGFPLGFQHDGLYYLNNHVTFKLHYHETSGQPGFYYVVGFEVEPKSIKQSLRQDLKLSCHPPSGRPLVCTERSFPNETQALCEDSKSGFSLSDPLDDSRHPAAVVYTYDVEWVASEIRAHSRWDRYIVAGCPTHYPFIGHWHCFWLLHHGWLWLFVCLSGIAGVICVYNLKRGPQINDLAPPLLSVEEADSTSQLSTELSTVHACSELSRDPCSSLSPGSYCVQDVFT